MEHAASRYAIHGKVSRRPSLGSRAQRSRFPTARKVQKRINTCKSSDVEALHDNPHSLDSRRAALAALLGGAFIGALPAEASESPSVLEWRGLRGFVVDEEQRAKLEAEARTNSEGLLCATPFSVDIVGITELLALIGAVVGGYSARQRKVEVERLNEQLRKINVQLRQQARSNAVYATGLNCAPSPPPPAAPETPLPPPPTAAATKSGEPLTVLPETRPSSAGNGGAQGRVERAEGAAAHTLSSMDDALMTAEQLECRDTLREGKKLLKVSGSAAMVRFEKGLVLAKALRDKISERRALRGLAAASRMQGKIRNAISFLEKVLAVSVEMQEFTGDSDAYGTIADLYTELGEFEKAAVFYDKYISRMMEDGTVV